MKIQLYRRVELPVPTLAGLAVIIGALLIVLAAFVLTVYPFLAVNRPLATGALAVEGWMNREDLVVVVSLLEQVEYDKIYTTGGPVVDGSYISLLYPGYSTLAEVAARQFIDAGVDSSVVDAVPRNAVRKDRTYSSALALRRHLVQTPGYDKVDVLSSGAHARRSWLLFESALSGVAEVGVRALPPRAFDPERWWVTSSGVRSVVGEVLAYCYAKFLFYPNPEIDTDRLMNRPN